MAFKTSFAALRFNKFSRDFGGIHQGTADPYVSGYGFIHFSHLPPRLAEFVNQAGNNQFTPNNAAEIGQVLSAACLSLTPVGGTLAKAEFTGLGGIKWGVPTNVDYGNEITIKFLEFNRTPILDIFHGWVRMIRDYRTGASDLVEADSGAGYSKIDYASTIYYWTTAPDGINVEYFACFDGCFPTKDPQDLYSFDVETVGKLEVEIPFHVDYVYHENWVKTKIEAIKGDFTASKETVKTFGSF